MKKSLIPILAVSLALIAGVVILVENLNLGGDNDDLLGRALLDSEGLSSVTSIEVKKGEAALSLVKDQANRWTTQDDHALPVDASKIVRFLESLTTTKIERAVTEDKGQYTELGLDAPTEVMLKDQDTRILKLLLGKNRAKGGQYALHADGTMAYMLDGAITGAVTEPESWELKILVDLPDSEVQTVTITPKKDGLKPLVVSRTSKEEPLKVADLNEDEQEKGGPASINRLLTEVAFTKRVDKSNVEAAAALEKPTATAEVKLFDGRTYNAVIGAIGEEQPKYFMQVKGDRQGATLDATQEKELQDLNRLNDAWSYEIASFIAKKFEKGRSDYVEAKKAEGSDQSAKPAAPDAEKKEKS